MKKISILILASAVSLAAYAQQPLDTLKMDEIRKSPVLSIEEAIAGRVAGVNVSFSDDAPGRMADYSFRGCNVTNPLFVVDGLRVDQAYVQSLNPALVESIVVLTDIAATSRYGSEGSAGVVEIELKKGQQGATKVDVDALWGANLLSKASLAGTEYVGGAMSSSLSHQYNVSVSGGSAIARNKFIANLGFTGDGGVLGGTSNNRFQGSLRYEQLLAKKFSFHVGASYRSSRQNGISTDSPYVDYSIVDGEPVPYDQPDAYIMYHVLGQGEDPVSTLENAYSKVITSYVTGDFGLNWDIVKGLKFNVLAFYSASTTDDQKFNNKKTIFGSTTSPYGMNTNAMALANRNNRYSAEALLSYANAFAGGSAVSATAGFHFSGTDLGYRGERTYNMTTEALGTAALNTGTYITVPVFDANYYHLQAYLRAQYSFKERYEVFASMSVDTFMSSEKGKWNILPSVGFAWNFANEGFLENTVLSSGRLTASWGKVGLTLPTASETGVVFEQIISQQIDASLSAGLWEDRLYMKGGAYALSFDGHRYYGLEATAKGYPFKTDDLKWGLFANATLGLGYLGGCWGGAGTSLDIHGFDFNANMYWNPSYFRCANLTAGYTIGRDLLKVCGLRLFVNARNLCHKGVYKGFDFASTPATMSPGRYCFTGGFSIQF